MSTATRSPTLIASGWKEVAQALTEGRVDLILVSEDLSGVVLRIEMTNDEYEEFIELVPEGSLDETKRRWMEYATRKKCKIKINVLSDDAIEWILKQSKKIGARIVIVSPESEVGEMLKKTFNGIVAKLRF